MIIGDGGGGQTRSAWESSDERGEAATTSVLGLGWIRWRGQGRGTDEEEERRGGHKREG